MIESGPFLWSSHMQSFIAQSIAKAEYIEALAASNQAL